MDQPQIKKQYIKILKTINFIHLCTNEEEKYYTVFKINKFYLCPLKLNAFRGREGEIGSKEKYKYQKVDSTPLPYALTVIPCNRKSSPGKMATIFFLEIFGFAFTVWFFLTKYNSSVKFLENSIEFPTMHPKILVL